jgi:hypothetical protein
MLGRRTAVALGGAVLAVTGVALPAAAAGASPHATSNPGFTVDQHRLVDTRVDQPTGPVQGLTTVHVTPDVPSGSTVELTVTATDASGDGYVSAYPHGSQLPSTANLSFTRGVTTSASSDVQVPSSGVIDITIANSAIQLVVDEQGYFAASSLTGIAPQRIADSRKGLGFAKTGPQSGTVTLQIPAQSVPAGAGVVALNVTATGASGSGNVVAYTGGAVPASGSLAYAAGTTASNLVYVTPAAGNVTFTVRGAPTDIVVDLYAYAPAGSSFTAATAERVADSRTATGLPQGPLTGAHTVTLTAAQVPAGTSAVALNLTATDASGTGYVVAYPAGSSQPTTGELSYTHGLTSSQTVVVPVGTNNQVTLFIGGTGPTQLVVDYEGAVGTN